nr:PIPO [Sunflower ring blotch virus]
MEKSYLDLLEEAWRELTWLEKCRTIWHSQRAKRFIIKPLKPTNKADLKGLYDTSPGACFTRSLSALKNEKEKRVEQVRLYINR